MSRESTGWAANRPMAGSRVVIDRLSRDAVAVATYLARAGAHVRIVSRDATPAELAEAQQQLASAAVQIDARGDADVHDEPFDVLVVDLDGVYPPPSTPYIVEARAGGKQVSTLADIVLRFSPARTAGVTGSAGKSTTTMLLASVLRGAGCAVRIPTDIPEQNPYPNRELVVGMADVAREDWVVAEITSAHLEYVESSPNVAVVTTLSPDHLTWHPTLEEYFEAKARLFLYQERDDWAIINVDDPLVMEMIAPRCRAQVVGFSEVRRVPRGAFLDGDVLVAAWGGSEVPVLSAGEAPMGRQYFGNVVAATAAGLAAGVCPDEIRAGLLGFTPLKQRLEHVATIGHVRLFNDGYAMTSRKARAGFESFDDDSLIAISGGVESVGHETLHGSDEERRLLAELCALISRKARHMVLVGPAARTLRPMLVAAEFDERRIHDAGDVATASLKAVELALAGSDETILLSPLFWMTAEERLAFERIAVEQLTMALEP